MAAAGDGDDGGRLSRYRESIFAGRSTERTVFFSDAVFAIAMTLLVLEIKVPEVEDPSRLLGALANEWYQFFAFALSFAFIAYSWTNHHNVWKFIDRYTSGLQWINLLLLFFITFLPVTTTVMSIYGPATAASPIIYAINVAGYGFTLLWLFSYARRRGLLHERVEPDLYLMLRRELTLMPIVFAVSCLIAPVSAVVARVTDREVAPWVSPLVAMLSWTLLSPLFAVSNRRTRAVLRRHDLDDERRDQAHAVHVAPETAPVD